MATHFSRVVQELKSLPGIGQKSAERIAFHFLETEKDKTKNLIHHLEKLIEHTVFCKICGLISEQSPCRICSSNKRDQSVICIIKNIQDAIIIEKSGGYQGLYHVLGGLLSPLKNIYEEHLQVTGLMKRISYTVDEIIFAFEKSVEAEATIHLIKEKIIKIKKIKFSRMAIGIPAGTSLEYLDHHTLKESMEHRYNITSQ